VPASDGAQYVSVDYDGTITMMEPVIYQVHCTVRMTDFPYDSHVCEMRWGSWSFMQTELNMVITECTCLTFHIQVIIQYMQI
jgi:hypothetical protein